VALSNSEKTCESSNREVGRGHTTGRMEYTTY
jgi:hypothetical protein